MRYQSEKPMKREDAERLLRERGIDFPDNADWYEATDSDGNKYLVLWGDDEPFVKL